MNRVAIVLRRWILVVVVLSLTTGQAFAAPVTFEAPEITDTDGSIADTASLRSLEIRLWDRWLHQDAAAYVAMLSPEVTRFSGRAPAPQRGAAQVGRALKREWSAFERPGGVISETMRLEHARFHVDGDFATAEYTVSVKGGTRWRYTDQGLVFQVLQRDGASWKVLHQVDSWSLDFDPTSGEAGQRSFSFGFVYSVADLKRAEAFYRPLLGAPESATTERCVFNVQGMRFTLERGDDIRRDWPNGYGVFLVPDLAPWRKKLKVTREATSSGDGFLMSVDADGNVFALLAVARGGRPAASLRGLTSVEAQRVFVAWLRQDAAALSKTLAPDARWFDDTRLRTRGVESGGRAVARALTDAYWPQYERNAEVRATASSELRRKVGNSTLVTFLVRLEGVGRHPFRENATVTMLLDARGRLREWLMAGDNRHDGLVQEFDYTGVPVNDIARAQAFYSGVLGLGKPYRDHGWRGWWSDRAVYGIYEGPTRPGHANGYVSFWVRSVDDVLRYLKKHGSRFPRIESITSTSGIDVEPSYRQVYATDSEGNGVVFTEYTGRRH